MAKEGQTHDRFLSVRIIPDHRSNASSVSLLSAHAMCRARLIVSRVSSRRGSARARSTILYGADSVIYLFAPRKHKQKRQTRRYTRVVRLANDSAHIRATWILGAGHRHSTTTDSNSRIRKRICGRYLRVIRSSLSLPRDCRDRGATFRGRA